MKGELIIRGEIHNFKEPISYIYAIYLDGDHDGIDSAKVINGKYTFKNRTHVTTLVTLFAKSPENIDNLKDKYMLVILTEPTIINVSSIDSLPNAKVLGSKAYLDYTKLGLATEPSSLKIRKLINSYSKKEEEHDISGMEEFKKRIDSVKKELSTIYYQFITKYPSSLAMPYVIDLYVHIFDNNTSQEDISKIEIVYNNLALNEKNSSYGRSIKKKLDSYKIKIGMIAPDFVQNDTLGNMISLKMFKGKYVLLDFWASWCIPCRRENPNLVKIYNKYKDRGFSILSISIDKPGDKSKWMDAIRKDGLTWTHVSDLKFWDNNVAKLYKVFSIPQNFLIDPLGKIIAKDLVGYKLEEKLKILLK